MAGELKDLDKLRKVVLGGALVTKSTSIMGHTGSPTALTGDISGLVGVGIAEATSGISMDLIMRKKMKKRKGGIFYG